MIKGRITKFGRRVGWRVDYFNESSQTWEPWRNCKTRQEVAVAHGDLVYLMIEMGVDPDYLKARVVRVVLDIQHERLL